MKCKDCNEYLDYCLGGEWSCPRCGQTEQHEQLPDFISKDNDLIFYCAMAFIVLMIAALTIEAVL